MSKEVLMSWLEANREQYEKIAHDIWKRPETALQEFYASTRQKEYLGEKGFRILEVDGVPTAFVAEFGSGKPVIAFLGEYDALPDMSQKVQTTQEQAESSGDGFGTQGAGHACGHNLIGTGSLAAAEAIQVQMESGELSGTVRYYGCPAEERYSGKILMQEKGVFDDVDLCMIWHPQDISGISRKQYYSSLAMMKIQFTGETGHSMAAKRYGGSALQAANFMVDGIQNMREYIWDHHRIHYYIADGGKTANLIPEKVAVYCEFRSADKMTLLRIRNRLKEIAEGAARMAGTEYSCEMEDELYSDLENLVMVDCIAENMRAWGEIAYTEEELEFVSQLAGTLPEGAAEKVKGFYQITESQMEGTLHTGMVEKDELIYLPADDAGNISQRVPFATFLAAMVPVGMPMHCWQVTALADSSVGMKCMMKAARVMAGAAYDFFRNPGLVTQVKEEFRCKCGSTNP